MPPIAKESEVLVTMPGTTTATPPAVSTAPESSTSISRPQPVALEVPVTINGARTVDGSDKREPFSETTKTVLVLSNGAVIRLASSVAPGQLLFLTNEKTKKEVVCQVVKSKNYRNVSGYVELEFTEPVVGFWGMRFPNDRIGPAPVAPPTRAATPSPLPVAPAAPRAPSAVPEVAKTSAISPKPVEPPLAEVRPEPVEVSIKPAEAPVPVAPVAALPEVPAPPLPVAPAAVPPPPLPPVQTVVPAAPIPVPGSAEALKLENARLLEQLSALSFSGASTQKTAPAPETLPVPTPEPKSVSDAIAKTFEFAQAEPPSPNPGPPVKTLPPVPAPSFEEESVKIPAWLEPLARNTAAPASTQELIEREKARRASEKPEISEPVIAPLTVADVAAVPEVRIPSFGDELLFDDKATGTKRSASSGKGAMIGAIAAGLLMVAGGGAWYLRQQNSPKDSQASAAVPAATVTAGVLQHQPVAAPQTSSASNLGAAPVSSPVTSASANSQNPTPHNAAASSVAPNNSVVVKPAQPLPARQQPHAVEDQPSTAPENDQPQLVQKKPGLGEIRLASPKITRSPVSQNTADLEPSPAFGANQIAPDGGSLSAELAAGKPAAPVEPVPVGGDVKPAKMVSSVPLAYPSLAKTQHVSGDVKIDALIDANGRVTSMKVISGPTLLHQAAMDALRQWKYQPATLDGKPVPMHLTVTLQFRLQ